MSASRSRSSRRPERSRGPGVSCGAILLSPLLAVLLSGCGPDFEIGCAGATVVIDGEPFTSCERCFAVLECESSASGALECPTGVRGSCSIEQGEHCCEDECVTCP